MSSNYDIIESKKRKKDINKALDIYIRNIDSKTSYTNTNEIIDHIFNPYNEQRLLFFYNLYLNDKLYGFAEFAYLPQTQTVVIDYICTEVKSQYSFYIFYKLAIEDIEAQLRKKNKHVRFLITEISLEKEDGLYVDSDSNYFRKMLSIENYSLLKYPYYQPPLSYDPEGPSLPFGIAIKSTSNSINDNLINKKMYLAIIHELYYSHYGLWYEKYYKKDIIYESLNELYLKIETAITEQFSLDNIALVNCPLFEEGKCKNVSLEPITISNVIKKRIGFFFSLLLWFVLSFAELFMAIFFPSIVEGAKYIGYIISGISSAASLITIGLFIRGFFRK